MVDPIQTTQGQQQGTFVGQTGQQQYHDDILGGEDIFANVPEVEEDLPYGDILEKKYQEDPSFQEYTAHAPMSEEVSMEYTPSTVNAIAEQEEEAIQQEVGLEETKVESLLDTKLQTDMQKKFGELFFVVKRIYDLKSRLGSNDEMFDIIGADNDKVFVAYRFFVDTAQEAVLYINKIEQNKDTQEESDNELRFAFNQAENSLEVMVNSVVLFDEMKDFVDDQKKKMQVAEKLNKFIFLTTEEQKKLEKEIQAKEEEEREKRRLQDIFRNF